MKTTEDYLRELEDKLCDKVVHMNWEDDERFETLREMQKYNKGIHDAMALVREMLESDEFKSPLAKILEGR